jgi:hypothetical protein
MNCKDLKYYKNDYISGVLPERINSQIEHHTNECRACRKEIEILRLLRKQVNSLSKSMQPDHDLWPGIEERISKKNKKNYPEIFHLVKEPELPGSEAAVKIPKLKKSRAAIIMGAASIIIAGIILGYFYFNQSPAAFWVVENLAGSPIIGNNNLEQYGMLEVGGWLETNEESRARIKVGRIGEVDVDPESRVKLIETKPSEHRISLDKGRIHAAIWAPPRLFFVETPSATAVDLGCMYTLEVDEEGSSFLHVTAGWVLFEFGEIESIIPFGASCFTKKGFGPGIPYFEDASDEFKTELSKFSFENGGKNSLQKILKHSREKDALSLWHLLIRTGGEEKNKVYKKLGGFISIPDKVSYEGIMNNDQKMLDILWETLGYGSRSMWDNF